MLSGLRQGAPLFVLYKNDLKTAIGEVVSVSPYVPSIGEPAPSFSTIGNYPRLINISAIIDGQNVSFKRINGDGQIADQYSDGILISESRDGILNELAAMKSNSARALEQMQVHRDIVAKCDSLIVELSPQLQKEQEQAREIASLKEDIAELKELLASTLGSKS